MDAAAGPEDAVLAHIGERHRAQIEVDLVAELFPQIVSEASGAIAAATDRRPGSAARGAYRLRHRQNDGGNPSLAAGCGPPDTHRPPAATPCHPPSSAKRTDTRR